MWRWERECRRTRGLDRAAQFVDVLCTLCRYGHSVQSEKERGGGCWGGADGCHWTVTGTGVGVGTGRSIHVGRQRLCVASAMARDARSDSSAELPVVEGAASRESAGRTGA